MSKFYNILKIEAKKEISDISASREEKFIREAEKYLNKENAKYVRKRREFSCFFCDFTAHVAIRIAQHVMQVHEQKFPYRMVSILSLDVREFLRNKILETEFSNYNLNSQTILFDGWY